MKLPVSNWWNLLLQDCIKVLQKKFPESKRVGKYIWQLMHVLCFQFVWLKIYVYVAANIFFYSVICEPYIGGLPFVGWHIWIKLLLPIFYPQTLLAYTLVVLWHEYELICSYMSLVLLGSKGCWWLYSFVLNIWWPSDFVLSWSTGRLEGILLEAKESWGEAENAYSSLLEDNPLDQVNSSTTSLPPPLLFPSPKRVNLNGVFFLLRNIMGYFFYKTKRTNDNRSYSYAGNT